MSSCLGQSLSALVGRILMVMLLRRRRLQMLGVLMLQAAGASMAHFLDAGRAARPSRLPARPPSYAPVLVRLSEWQQVPAAPRVLAASCRPSSVAAQCDPAPPANQSVTANRPRLLLFRSNLLHGSHAVSFVLPPA